MANIISIPTPCNEDWNAMTPKDQGRHCDSCCKTVVDFTTWQPHDILQYFNEHKNVCGRFTAQQLEEPIPTAEDFVRQISYFNMPTIKKVAAIFIFAFTIGSSACDANAHGLPITTEITITKPEILHGGSTVVPPNLKNKLPIQLELKKPLNNDDNKKPAKKKKHIIKKKPPYNNNNNNKNKLIHVMGTVVNEPTNIIMGDTILPPKIEPICIKDSTTKKHLMGKPAIRKTPLNSNPKPTEETKYPTMGMVAVRQSNK